MKEIISLSLFILKFREFFLPRFAIIFGKQRMTSKKKSKRKTNYFQRRTKPKPKKYFVVDCLNYLLLHKTNDLWTLENGYSSEDKH